MFDNCVNVFDTYLEKIRQNWPGRNAVTRNELSIIRMENWHLAFEKYSADNRRSKRRGKVVSSLKRPSPGFTLAEPSLTTILVCLHPLPVRVPP